jgi:large subunit ribosomal protein L9
MKVLLLKDVYNLGRAGDVKKVADGYGRNYLLPQGFAVLATPGALKQSEFIRKSADVQRTKLNTELGSVAEQIDGLKLTFEVKAGETGKLYGSITTAMIAEAVENETGVKIDRRQIDTQPIKLLGEHKARVRLTIDLVPELDLVIHREGDPIDTGEDFEDLASEEYDLGDDEFDAEAALESEDETAGIEAAVEDDAATIEEPVAEDEEAEDAAEEIVEEAEEAAEEVVEEASEEE